MPIEILYQPSVEVNPTSGIEIMYQPPEFEEMQTPVNPLVGSIEYKESKVDQLLNSPSKTDREWIKPETKPIEIMSPEPAKNDRFNSLYNSSIAKPMYKMFEGSSDKPEGELGAIDKVSNHLSRMSGVDKGVLFNELARVFFENQQAHKGKDPVEPTLQAVSEVMYKKRTVPELPGITAVGDWMNGILNPPANPIIPQANIGPVSEKVKSQPENTDQRFADFPMFDPWSPNRDPWDTYIAEGDVQPQPEHSTGEGGMVRTLVHMIGSGANIIPVATELALSMGPLDIALKGLNPKHKASQDKFEADMYETSKKIIAWADTIGKPPTGKYAKPPEDVWGYFDPKRIFMVASENLGQLILFGGAMMANPVVGTALMFAAEGGEAKSAILDYEAKTGTKIDPNARLWLPVAVGSFNAALEKTGLDGIFAIASKSGLRKKLMQLLWSMQIEGGTEGLQQINHILAQEQYDPIPRNKWEEFKESYYAGVIMALMGGSVGMIPVENKPAVEQTLEPTDEPAVTQVLEPIEYDKKDVIPYKSDVTKKLHMQNKQLKETEKFVREELEYERQITGSEDRVAELEADLAEITEIRRGVVDQINKNLNQAKQPKAKPKPKVEPEPEPKPRVTLRPIVRDAESTKVVEPKVESKKEEKLPGSPKNEPTGGQDTPVFKITERPDMENPIHSGEVNGETHRIQRVYNEELGAHVWVDADEWSPVAKKGDEEKGFLGHTKAEAIKKLQGEKSYSLKPVKTGQQNTEFFTGKAKEASSDVPYEPVLDTPKDTPVAKDYKKFTGEGNFTGHISKMIPGFAEKQQSVAQGIVNLEVDNFLDIGASEGGLVKTVAANSNTRAVAVDPNPEMQKNFNQTEDVEGAEYRLEALGASWTEGDGTVIKEFKTDEKFDVINEDFTFQFISSDRAGQIKQVKGLLKDDGVFITSEKFFTENFEQNEKKKLDHQKKYFKPSELTKDKEEIITGMESDMVQDTDYEKLLRENFKYVEEFWNAGNFKGYIASDSKAKIASLRQDLNTNSLDSEFADTGTHETKTEKQSKIKDIISNHPLFKNIELTEEEGLSATFSRGELEALGYTDLTRFTPLKEGDEGYVKGEENYAVQINGHNTVNAEGFGQIVLNPEATTDAYVEDGIVEPIFKQLRKLNPELLSRIKRWARGIDKARKKDGIEGPSGLELFSQAFTFNVLGYAGANPDVAETFWLPADIISDFEELIGQDVVAAIRGDSKPSAIRLPAGKESRTLDVQRQDRVTDQNVKLHKDDRARINTSNLSREDKKGAIRKYKTTKENNPEGDGWAEMHLNNETPEHKPVEVVNGKVVLNWKKVPYSWQKPEDGFTAKEWKAELTRRIIVDIEEVLDRANRGDRNAKAIVENSTWYSGARAMLYEQFGALSDLMFELLGATSAKTDVKQNFKYAQDILERYTQGDFDEVISTFVKHIEAGGTARDYKGPVILQKNGVKYGFNSRAGTAVLASQWLIDRPGSTPKTRNFAKNLIGSSHIPTVDVWAARWLNRLAGKPRVPVLTESSVGGKFDNELKITGQYAFGADAMTDAVVELKKHKELSDLTPESLQAMVWMSEKELWTAMNWTNKRGEGGSVETELLNRGYERGVFGVTVEDAKADGAQFVQTMTDVMNADKNIIMARAQPAIGGYNGKYERSFDIEFVQKPGTMPVEVIKRMVKWAVAENQSDTFVAKVLKEGENSENARPGIEIYFSKNQSSRSAIRLTEKIDKAATAGGFTIIKDVRNPKGAKGVRVLYIPEVSARLDLKYREKAKVPGFVRKDMDRKLADLTSLARELVRDDANVHVGVYLYDTKVIGKEMYDVVLQADQETFERSIWQGRPVGEEVQQAIERYEDKWEPSTSFSLKQKPVKRDADGNLQLRKPRRGERFLTKVIDLNDRIKRVQEQLLQQGATIPESSDVYLKKTLLPKKIGRLIDKVHEAEVKPLLEKMVANGVGMEELNDWLHAKHAVERNEAMKAKGYEGETGSGMTAEKAQEIFKEFADKADVLEAIADDVYAILDRNLDRAIEYGLMKPEEAEDIRTYYEWYVPMGREITEFSTGIGTGQGQDIRGKETKRAKGSERTVLPILPQIINKVHKTLIRGEKNKVGLAMAELIRLNPAQFWSVEHMQYIPRFDEEGEMQFLDPKYKWADNVIGFREDGKQYFITLGEEDGHLARALKETGKTHGFAAMRPIISFLSVINTKYSPEFLIRNFQRDFGEAMINIGDIKDTNLKKMSKKKLKGMRWAIMKNLPSSIRAIYRQVRGKGTDPEFEAFLDAGGKVGHFWLDKEQNVFKDLEKEIDRIKNPHSAKNTLKDIGDLIGDYNEAIELGIRFSTWKHLVKLGLSESKSAAITGDLTVDFNKMGEWGPLAKSLYLFINPQVQGNERAWRGIFRSKRVMKGASAMFMGGFIVGLLSQLMSDEGDEAIPDYRKNTRIILPTPDGKNNFSVGHLPYGYNSFWATGRYTSEWAMGKITMGELGEKALLSALDSFNPLGGSRFSFANFVPTAFKPLVEIEMNENWMGYPINPQGNPFVPEVPDHQKYWKNTATWSKALTKLLSDHTGGGVKPDGSTWAGKIDMSPETLEYLVNSYTGSVGTFVANSYESIKGGHDVATGKMKPGDYNWDHLPFARDFYGRIDKKRAKENFVYSTMENVGKKEIKGRELRKFVDSIDFLQAEGFWDQEKVKRTLTNFYKGQGQIPPWKETDKPSKLKKPKRSK